MKRFIIFLTIASILLIQFHTYIQQGFPYTHDGENHLVRFANYRIALREGQVPPRFAPNLMNHFGYPVFNFNYPLANILSVPFSFFKINVELTFKLLSVLASLGALIGVYFYTNNRKTSLFTTVCALLIFGLQPYLINTILFRGNIGELFALCLLPWVMYIIDTISDKKAFSLMPTFILSAFFLSHNVTILLVSPWIIGFALVKHWNNKKKLIHLFQACLFAIGLTTWFWIPALAEAHYTVLKDADVALQFQEHFVYFSQILFGQLQFGFSLPGKIDSLSFQLGVTQLYIGFLALLVVVKKFWQKSNVSLSTLYFLISIFTLIFLQLNIALPIWKLFPLLKIIQFPWRLAVFFPTLFCFVYLDIAHQLSNSLKKALVAFILIQAITMAQLKPVDFFHRQQIDYDLFSQSTSTQNENRARTFTFEGISEWQPQPMIIGNGKFKVDHWTGSQRQYSLFLDENSLVIEPTMNFPGWITEIIDSQGSSSYATYVFDQVGQGRIAYILPPGDYSVHTFFSQRTPARMIGNITTIATLFIIISGFIFSRKKVLHE